MTTTTPNGHKPDWLNQSHFRVDVHDDGFIIVDKKNPSAEWDKSSFEGHYRALMTWLKSE